MIILLSRRLYVSFSYGVKHFCFFTLSFYHGGMKKSFFFPPTRSAPNINRNRKSEPSLFAVTETFFVVAFSTFHHTIQSSSCSKCASVASRYFRGMYQSFVLILLLLRSLLVITDANHRQIIKFLGHEFSYHQWSMIKQTMKCWTSNGEWVVSSEYFQYDNNLDLSQNFDRVSPCHKYPANTKKHWCPNIFKSNASRTVWKPSKTICKHPLQPLSVIMLNEIMNGKGK